MSLLDGVDKLANRVFSVENANLGRVVTSEEQIAVSLIPMEGVDLLLVANLLESFPISHVVERNLLSTAAHRKGVSVWTNS